MNDDIFERMQRVRRDNERRERFKSAMEEATAEHGHPLLPVAADAAVAEADAEQEENIKRGDRIAEALALEEQKNARLRATQRGQREDLEAAEAEIREQDEELTRLRAELERRTLMLQVSRDENARLRADLEKQDKDVKRLAAGLGTARQGNTRRDATIERVRAVLNKWKGVDPPAAEISAALEGRK